MAEQFSITVNETTKDNVNFTVFLDGTPINIFTSIAAKSTLEQHLTFAMNQLKSKSLEDLMSK